MVLDNWPTSSGPPTHVYLIAVTTEWMVDAVADGPHAVRHVEMVVDKRLASGNVGGERHRVKVFKARLEDLEEVELLPSTVVGPQLRPKNV